MSKISKTKKVWENMMSRCYKKWHPLYSKYGGRGILVASAWHTYANFLADMGPSPPNMWLGRIDRSQGYSPSNCAYMTTRNFARHTKEAKVVKYKGKEWTVQDLADAHGIPHSRLRMRLARGWNLHRALTTPLQLSARPKCYRWGNKFYTLTDLCKYLNLDRELVKQRLRAGWPLKHIILPAKSGYKLRDRLKESERE